jgi:hypothetical protein
MLGSIAVGDTRGDIDLLLQSKAQSPLIPTLIYASTPNPNGWRIVVERKSQIYSLEPKDGTYKLVEAKS